MSQSSKSSFLENMIRLLVQRFGVKSVRAALAKASIGCDEEPQKPIRRSASRDQKAPRPTVANALEEIQASQPEKHRLLSQFLDRLKDRKILPESQDIRHFAHLVGIKGIEGKARKDMIPTLMHFLLEQSIERLQTTLPRADSISEQQRQQGFSVLTDKLLGNKYP